MRKIMGTLVVGMAMLVAGGRAARAQDDPFQDELQQQNQITADAMQQIQDAQNAMQAAAQINANIALMEAGAQATIDAMNAGQNDVAPAAPALPSTPRPQITPKGGRFAGSVQVTIADMDEQAVVFYTTNGKRPTTSSTRYAGPIVVTEKTKVQALAFDVSMEPSGVVSKTFRVKS